VSTTVPAKKGARSAGVLLHPVSLPGDYGIGDLGHSAYAWVDALARAGQTWWQILPLGPTGFGDSPYQCFSAFAGNPYLVSPDILVQEGLIQPADLAGCRFPHDRVDYGPVLEFKIRLLDRAWHNYQSGRVAGLPALVEEFSAHQASWLDDYALFMALKDAHSGASWLDWPKELRLRQAAPLAQARRELADTIGKHRFRQFLFQRQWQALKRYANERGIKLMGDVPIFVSADSADVWANPQFFQLDGECRPRVVAGVPPDYFSATGQLWGNPLYDWEALKATRYAWWTARVRATLGQVDLIRLDHFRGFEAYWEVAAGMPTAQIGRWVAGPGADFFESLRADLGTLPLVAEDLGVITPEVEALREQFRLPGMRILQFAFDSAGENRYLPHNFDRHTVVYTGTHDNDTTRGWFESRSEAEKHFTRRYLGRDSSDVVWDFIRLAWSSVADYALAPLQDILNLDTSARMNLPGRAAGNWAWRFTANQLTEPILERLGELTELYGRSRDA
jgi:4-alpha-glucanotransferase